MCLCVTACMVYPCRKQESRVVQYSTMPSQLQKWRMLYVPPKFKTPHHTHSSLPYCKLLLCGLLAPLQYEETSFSTPEYENVQFAPPANEVEELYGQLAERKCIEIPRQSVR